MPVPAENEKTHSSPPFFRTWGRFYALVVANTLLLYLLLLLFSRFAR